jgi:hypothetical protein
MGALFAAAGFRVAFLVAGGLVVLALALAATQRSLTGNGRPTW